METTEENANSEIRQFFHNSAIFLTGGTGFLGKVIISKLLLTCNVSRIYILIRKKNSKTESQRMQELFDHPVFVHLKNNIPDCENRFTLIKGDCELKNLGISREDEEILQENVNVVIHCAAAMNMIGSLKKAIATNVRGTKHLFDLSKKMINLKSFLYFSTIGAHIERDVIEETIYKSHIDYKDLLHILEIDHLFAVDQLDQRKIIGDKITNYILTKAIGENILSEEKIHIPVIIFRSDFANPCWKEPYAGYLDNLHGVSGVIALNLLDITNAFYNIDENMAYFTPADLIVNALIATIPYSYKKFITKTDEKESLFIYNYVAKTNKIHTLNVGEIITYMKKEHYSHLILCKNKYALIIRQIFFGYIPAATIDLLAFLSGKKIRALKAFNSIVEINLKFCAKVPCEMTDNNAQNCWNDLNETDKTLFPFVGNTIIPEVYLPIFMNSIHDYVDKKLEDYEHFRKLAYWAPKIRRGFKTVYLILGSCFIGVIVHIILRSKINDLEMFT